MCGEEDDPAVIKLSGKPLELFCSGETADSGEVVLLVPEGPASEGGGKVVGRTTGVLLT